MCSLKDSNAYLNVKRKILSRDHLLKFFFQLSGAPSSAMRWKSLHSSFHSANHKTADLPSCDVIG